MEWGRAQPGQRYKILYQIPGVHQKPRIAVMEFMAFEPNTLHGDDLVFSLRPLAGTQTLKSRWIISAEQTIRPVMAGKIWRP